MTFPVTVEHRGQKAKIYKPGSGFPFYRVAFKVDGKRRMLTFGSYGEAKAAAEAKVKELHKGQTAGALTAKEARDALRLRDMLIAYRQETGKRLSAIEGLENYIESVKALPDNSTVLAACRDFAETKGKIKPKPIAEAVTAYLHWWKHQKRVRPYHQVYVRNIELWLTTFAETFPGHLVSDIVPPFIAKYLDKFKDHSAKARNDRRGALAMWLRDCGKHNHIAGKQVAELLDCDAMNMEELPDADIGLYTAGELRKIFTAIQDESNEACNDDSRDALCAVTALQAFGGARLEEALRLRWEDLYRTPGHVEITGMNAKTRQRRLLEVGPALKVWLRPFKGQTGPIWAQPVNSYITEWARVRESVGVPSKKNGLRHSFISFSYILRGEIETSALAGTSPTILHSNYRGLARKSEAKAWFNVRPAKQAAGAKIIPMPEASAA